MTEFNPSALGATRQGKSRERESGKTEIQLRGSIRNTIWTIQGYGLALVTFLSFFPAWFHLEEYVFLGLFAVAIGAVGFEEKTVWDCVRTPLDLPLLLLVGWVLFTIPFATDSAYSFAEWRKLVTQILVFYWGLLVLRNQDHRMMTRRMLAVVVLAAMFLFPYSLGDFLTRGGTWRDRYIRAIVPGSDSNYLSNYVVFAIPLLIVTSMMFRAWWQRAVCIGALALALLTGVAAYNRAAWLGLMVEGIAFGHFTRSRKVMMWMFVCVVVIGVGLFAVSKVGYQSSTVDPLTLGFRIEVWKLGISKVLEHPIVGVGYGNNTFTKIFRNSQEIANANHLHNTFLMVAMGSGIPALIFFIWTLMRTVRLLLHSVRQISDWEKRWLLIGVAVSLVGFLTRNIFDYMFSGSLAYLFWILVATGFAARMAIKQEDEIGCSKPMD
jgi:O-antigen ligase